MGFWILMAMLACAVGAVVVALAIEGRSGPTRAAPVPDGALRWLAVVAQRTDSGPANWAERLPDQLPPTVDARVQTTSASTLDDIKPEVIRAVAEHSPDVVLLWVALDDVLAGVSLHDHEVGLNALLADLDAGGVIAVLGNLPDLSALPGAVGAGLPASELRLLTERWNGAIARLAHHHRALVVDLHDLAVHSDVFAAHAVDLTDGLTGTANAAVVAERFLPVLRQALVGARRRHLATSAPNSL